MDDFRKQNQDARSDFREEMQRLAHRQSRVAWKVDSTPRAPPATERKQRRTGPNNSQGRCNPAHRIFTVHPSPAGTSANPPCPSPKNSRKEDRLTP